MDYVEKISTLAESIDNNAAYTDEDKKEIKEFLLSQFEKLPAYFTAVIMGNVELSMMNGHYDIVKVHQIETNRRSAHISAASAINAINRIAKQNANFFFFEFPEINNQPLVTGKLYSNGTKEDAQLMETANNHRELAALRIYGFCKAMFLYSNDRSRYNIFEGYTEKEMDAELQDMSERKRPVVFDKKYVSLNELRDEAEKVFKKD